VPLSSQGRFPALFGQYARTYRFFAGRWSVGKSGVEEREGQPMAIPEILFHKLCFVLQRGFQEVRSLALANSREQLFDLADTLEELPGLLPEWSDEHMPLLRRLLQE